MLARLLAILDSDARIPQVVRRGRWLYNFWQDAEHPRGLWRRTTLTQYRLNEPDWDTVLDLDALARRFTLHLLYERSGSIVPGAVLRGPLHP